MEAYRVTDPSMELTSASMDSSADSAALSSGGDPGPKPVFPAPTGVPNQEGPLGIRYDFNDGARVALPSKGGPWLVRLSDLDTGNTLFQTHIEAGRVNTAKRYYVRCRIEVWRTCEGVVESVMRHEYSCRDREVAIQFPVGTLGDSLAWAPYAVKFQRAHGCRLTVVVSDRLIPLFKSAYPDFEFISVAEVQPERFYATYNIGLFFGDDEHVHQPCDFRLVGLHRTAGYILGVDPGEEPAKIALDDETRPIAEPYVCIAAQSTTQAKYWNNPNGWREIVAFLRTAGYRIVCIDQKPVHGGGLIWNHIPHGVEDETGDRPLIERARWLKHADFFIGLSSGLSWLAWSTGTPVVMISGFTHPVNEFSTPYRVINYHACNSCWNDPQLRFDQKDFLWCPRHANTSRQFECTRLITSEQVKAAIRRIPAFARREARMVDKESG